MGAARNKDNENLIRTTRLRRNVYKQSDHDTGTNRIQKVNFELMTHFYDYPELRSL